MTTIYFVYEFSDLIFKSYLINIIIDVDLNCCHFNYLFSSNSDFSVVLPYLMQLPALIITLQYVSAII